MKLYSGPLSMFGMKAAIACYEKGLDFELEMVPFDSDDRYQPKHPEILRINPKAQVPVLIDGSLELYDSTQIFEYLEDVCPEPPLWPAKVAARAQARQLELMTDEVYFPQVVRLMYVQADLQGKEARDARAACSDFHLRMEHQLADKHYLVGEISFADIAFFMASLFGERMSAILDKGTPGLQEWRSRMCQRLAVKSGVAPLIAHLHAAGRPVPDFL